MRRITRTGLLAVAAFVLWAGDVHAVPVSANAISPSNFGITIAWSAFGTATGSGVITGSPSTDQGRTVMTGLKLGWAAAIAALLLLAGPTRATVITFDDLSPAPFGGIVIPTGYQDFNWTSFDYETPSTNPAPTGYQAGLVSPPNDAFNAGGGTATMRNPSNAFNFTGAYLTAAWRDGLSVEVKGYLNNVLEYDTTVNPLATAPTLFTFNYNDVDTLVFSSSGGTQHPGYSSGMGSEFVMDNFTFTAIPEPSTTLLLAVGVVGLAARRQDV